MKTILVSTLLAVSFINLKAQITRELPIIADRNYIQREVVTGQKARNMLLDAGDELWNIDHGDLRGNGPAYVLAPRFDNRREWAYIGGAFTEIDGQQLRGIAQYNAGDFTEVGGGVSGGNVYAILHDVTGLYIAGNFTQAGDIPVHHIAHWDGGGWHDLGAGGTDSTILALCMFDSTLYAGGNFTKIGGVKANYIAKYDLVKREWQPVIDGGVNGVNGGVAALIANDPALYVGGGFTKAGSKDANKIAVYQNKQWVDIGGVSGTNAFVACFALENFSSGRLFVGGSFDDAGSITDVNNIAQYNPGLSNGWARMGTGFNGTVFAISAASLPGFDQFSVCGDFTRSGNTVVNHVAHCLMFGDNWQSWGAGLDKPAYALLPSFNSSGFITVMVGGEFNNAGNSPSHNVAIHYDFIFDVDVTGPEATFSIHPSIISSKEMKLVAHLPQAKPHRLSVIDALGRIISSVVQDEAASEVVIPTATLVNGLYYCVLEAGGRTATQKFLVAY